MSAFLLPRAALAVCLSFCAASCGESVQSAHPVAPVTINSNATTHLSGDASYASDVQSIPNEPFSGGWVATINPDALAQLIDDRALTKHATYKALQLPVLPEDFKRFSASTAISATGQYSLTTPAGEQFVCLITNGASAGHGLVLGCTKLALLGGEQRLQLFFGEAEFYSEGGTS